MDIASYANENTPYIIALMWMILLHPLSKHPMACLGGLKNLLKSNADKCPLLISTDDRVRMNLD